MAHEVTVPLLPCRSIDEITDFYTALGFVSTYRQTKPNPYVALRREDLHLHFFGLPGFDPADSYGSCVVLSPDVVGLHAAFAAGLRARYGKVPVAGFPRMTRPRPKKNMDGATGFSVVDPGGNWIRITAAPDPAGPHSPTPAPATPAPVTHTPSTPAPADRLAVALENAVVQGDSRGEPAQAAKILDGALARWQPGDDPVSLVRALAYRAELAIALDDHERAAAALDRAGRTELTPGQRHAAAEALEAVAELSGTL